jgi:hypothetical protein
MTSWFTWPVDWLARRLSGERVQQIQEALSEDRFVGTQEWAQLNRISPDEAEQELERGVKSGILKKMFLYEGSDSPITFVVPEVLLGRRVRLSDIGDFSEEEDRELLVSRNRSRPVYVAARS